MTPVPHAFDKCPCAWKFGPAFRRGVDLCGCKCHSEPLSLIGRALQSDVFKVASNDG